MPDPFTLATLGLASAAGLYGYNQQRQNNMALRGAAGRAEQSAAITAGQVREQAAFDRTAVRRESDDIEATLRVLAAFGGVGGGGSLDRLVSTNQYETGVRLGSIDRRASNEIASIRTAGAGRAAQFRGQQSSSLVAGLSGALNIAGLIL